MSRFLTILAGSMLLPSSLAMGLPSPTSDQEIYDWDWSWPSFDYNGDGTLDSPGGTGLTGDLIVDLVGDCSVDYSNPPGQPKNPDGCGTFDTADGGDGFWLYYDHVDTTGWWRNRLLMVFNTTGAIYRAKYSNTTCGGTAGTQSWTGSSRYVDVATGTALFGSFDYCTD